MITTITNSLQWLPDIRDNFELIKFGTGEGAAPDSSGCLPISRLFFFWLSSRCVLHLILSIILYLFNRDGSKFLQYE